MRILKRVSLEDGTIFSSNTAQVYVVNQYGQTELVEVGIIPEELPLVQEKNIPVSESSPMSQYKGGASGAQLQGGSASSSLSGSSFQGSSIPNTSQSAPDDGFLTQVAGKSTSLQTAGKLTESQISESIETGKPSEARGLMGPIFIVFAVALVVGIFFYGLNKFRQQK